MITHMKPLVIRRITPNSGLNMSLNNMSTLNVLRLTNPIVVNTLDIRNMKREEEMESGCDGDNMSIMSSSESISSNLEDKPKRKRMRLDHLSSEEKMMRRKLKNRVAAQSARDRKKMKMGDLEHGVEYLQNKNSSLTNENLLLKQRNEQLERENMELKMRLGLIEKQQAETQASKLKAEVISHSNVSLSSTRSTSPIESRLSFVPHNQDCNDSSVGSAEFINAPQPQEQGLSCPVKVASTQQTQVALLLMMQFACLLTIMNVMKSLRCFRSALKTCSNVTMNQLEEKLMNRQMEVKKIEEQKIVGMVSKSMMTSLPHCKMKMTHNNNWKPSRT